MEALFLFGAVCGWVTGILVFNKWLRPWMDRLMAEPDEDRNERWAEAYLKVRPRLLDLREVVAREL